MSGTHIGSSGNHLINLLSHSSRREILGACEPIHLAFGTVLCEPGRPFEYVYFPLTGFISIVASVDHHNPIEVGLIGNEGMRGAMLALGVKIAPLRGQVQGAGRILRMEVDRLSELLAEQSSLRRLLNQYLYILMAQLARSNACICFHSLGARLAYWLLMMHDHSHADDFLLTHQFFSDMLGVRRGAVTLAAGSLQRQHIIRYRRGVMSVLNRNSLERLACNCYSAALTRASPSLTEEPAGIWSAKA